MTIYYSFRYIFIVMIFVKSFCLLSSIFSLSVPNLAGEGDVVVVFVQIRNWKWEIDLRSKMREGDKVFASVSVRLLIE